MAHVLLIDDDPHFIAEQVRQAFPPPVYTVGVARSGAEGLECVRSDSPDVVLLDVRLPDRSGLDVYEEIRGLDARLPVIFVTVAKAADTAIEAMKRGAFDYIGDMPLPLQSKVLRLLQEQAFERLGGNETIRTDVRLIAATHRDLKSLVAEGQFRLDLYYRIGVFTIHLPPLRERGDDVALLALNHVRRFSRELGREVRDIAPETMERLRDHSWPGNVRELQSVLKQAVLQARGLRSRPRPPRMLTMAFLPPCFRANASTPPSRAR